MANNNKKLEKSSCLIPLGPGPDFEVKHYPVDPYINIMSLGSILVPDVVCFNVDIYRKNIKTVRQKA